MWEKVSIVITVLLVVTLGISLSLCGEKQSEEGEKNGVRKITKGTSTITTVFFYQENEAKLLWLKANSLINSKPEEALKGCKKIIEGYPDSDYLLAALATIGSCWRIMTELEVDPNHLPVPEVPFEIKDPALYLLVKAEIKRNYAYEWTKKAQEYKEESLQDYYEIINKYPESKFADESQWKIALHYYNKRDYDRAIKEFQKVIDKYPDSNSAPSARHKIGECYDYGYKDTNRAIKEWQRVIDEYSNYRLSTGLAQEYIAANYEGENYKQAIIEYQKIIDNYPDYYDIGGITWRIERCRLLIEFQKRGVDITEYESEDPERLSLLLKLYDKGVKEKDILRLRSGAPLTELKRLLDQEEIFEFKDEPFTPSTEPLIEEEDG